MKYIMKNGAFYAKENDSTVTSISGTLAGIRTLQPEDAPMKLQLDLKREEESGPVVDTLTLRLYADPALKVLRCLYGIAEIIAGKVITIALEEREGRGALIVVSADNEVLAPCGSVEAYAYDKKLFTDKTYVFLKRCLEFEKTVLVYANADGEYPTDYDGGLNVEAISGYIRDMRRLGRTGELTVKKTTFTVPSTAKGYLKALRDLSVTRAFRFTDNEDEIQAIWTAFTEELPEQPAADTGDEAVSAEEEC